jgi:hypothetical protein
MIVYSVYEHGYKQCTDSAIGTYISSVSNFMQGYMNQKDQDAEDQGQDFERPDASQYIYCTAYQADNKMYYLQLGCSEDSNQAITIRVYEDSTCTKLSSDDPVSDMDVSTIQVRHVAIGMCVCCMFF